MQDLVTSFGGENTTIKNRKLVLAIPLMAIAVIAIGFGMTSNVFALSTTPANSANVDQQGQNDGQYGDQSAADDMSEKNSPEGHESSDSASDKDNLQQ